MILASEFAAVEVEVEENQAPDGPRLRITDLGTGSTAWLDAAAALALAEPQAGRDLMSGGGPEGLTIELDLAANGPRLKIADSRRSRLVYLDPLELADAAATGTWGQFPAPYGGRLDPA